MRYIIFGGLGQVGLPTARALATRPGAEVVVADVQTPPPALRAELDQEDVEVVTICLPDDKRTKELVREGDYVLLAAAQLTSGFDADPAAATRLNVLGAESVLRAARQVGVTRAVLCSSVAVYGSPLTGRIDESSPARLAGMSHANLCYATTKLLAESLGRLHFADVPGEFASLRYSAIYGPSARGAGATSVRLRQAVVNWAHQTEPTDRPKFGWTDLIYIDDVVAANIAALTAPTCEGSFTIATGVTCGPHDVDEAVRGPIGQALADTLSTSDRVAPFTFEVERAASVLGWQACISLAEGVARSAGAWLDAQ